MNTYIIYGQTFRTYYNKQGRQIVEVLYPIFTTRSQVTKQWMYVVPFCDEYKKVIALSNA